MRFIELHDGSQKYLVNVNRIRYILTEHQDSAWTIVDVGGKQRLGVEEKPDQIIELMMTADDV